MAETIYVKYNGTRRLSARRERPISVPLKKNTVCFLRRADG